MDDAALRDLLKRLEVLERTTVRYRQGEVSDPSPLDVTLGGADIVLEDVPALVSAQPLPDAANIAALTFGNGLLVLGQVGAPPAWTAYTPTVTSVTLGTGGTNLARYSKTGRTITARGKITLGTGGSFTGTDVTIAVPETAEATVETIGQCLGIDSGVWRHMGYCVMAAGGATFLSRFLPATLYGSPVNLAATGPFIWGVGDTLSWQITYEAAS